MRQERERISEKLSKMTREEILAYFWDGGTASEAVKPFAAAEAGSRPHVLSSIEVGYMPEVSAEQLGGI